MRAKQWGRGLVILLVLAMLFTMTAANLSASTAGRGNNKVDVLIGFQGLPNPGLVRAFGGEIYAEFTLVDVIAARMTEQQARALTKHPAIQYIELDGMVYAINQTVPWGIDRVFDGPEFRISTWGKSTGAKVSMFVLDTGIDRYHQDLTVAGGRRFYVQGFRLVNDDKYDDGHGHGTHVAGTIGALNNEIGVVGVAPDVALYAVKVLTDSGSGSVSAIIAGIEWAVAQGKDNSIINMSLGSSSYNRSFEDACKNAYGNGLLVVAAAGNSGNSDGTGDNVGYPAKYESVIAVAASDLNDNRASFSSTGPDVDLIAPGVGVLSTLPGNKYGSYSGTSMASPHVAGVAALVWAANSTMDNIKLRGILNGTAENIGLPDNHQGSGLVRADLAVAAALGTDPPTKYSLKLVVNPEDAGNVTGEDVYSEGTNINITATASTNYIFVNWTNEDGNVESTNANFTYTMPGRDVTLTANFELEEEPPIVKYDLTTSSSEGGSVTEPGEGNFNFDKGTVVNLKAVPMVGYQFVNWTGDTATIAGVNAAETTITMSGNYSIIANFEKLPSYGIVSVDSITYYKSGGKSQDRHLHITLALKDDVSGASVSIELWRGESIVFTTTGTTGSNGTVTFSYNNAPSGTYTTKVTAVTAEGLTWDGITPDNTYDK